MMRLSRCCAVVVILSWCSVAVQGADRYASRQTREYNGPYRGEYLDRVAFPLGGIGAGMICLEGNGCLAQVSVRHQPEIFHEPLAFAAVCVKGDVPAARVLEGPVPGFKVLRTRGGEWRSSGNGAGGTSYGLPRFGQAELAARFPFATLSLTDSPLPVQVQCTAWSPFTPPECDDSSLPVAALEYTLTNTSTSAIDAVFSFHCENFMAVKEKPGAVVQPIPGGFQLSQSAVEGQPEAEGHFLVSCDHPDTQADCAWFRGGWFDALTMIWQSVSTGQVVDRAPHAEGKPSDGASLYVPLHLDAGQARTVRLRLAWYVPGSGIRTGQHVATNASLSAASACCPAGVTCNGAACSGTDCAVTQPAPQHYVPWYATRFSSAGELMSYWQQNYDRLRTASATFRDCFFDSSMPPEVVEAVAANLSILKSPTCLRQHDGRFWGWEGCRDTDGCCSGSCTHVWNYAQALPHLFPQLERTMREASLAECQDDAGHQTFRTPLPIGEATHGFHAAADGQLGNVMRVYREWRISGDTQWMLQLWPQVKQSLLYCIESWDPSHEGTLREPHHNTYDIEFWGPDGMCTSMYVGALEAATRMGQEAGDDVALFGELAQAGREVLRKQLFNGEYFIQQIQLEGLRATDPTSMQGINMNYSPEAVQLLKKEGPKYQYGSGCLSDGVLGAWIAEMCGLGAIMDQQQVRSHLVAVHKYNFLHDLSSHANPQRPAYALNSEGGLLLCSWPRGDALSLPFVYSNEVWTGIEYQVASHLILLGQVDDGLEIVRACRDRYDGRLRNPFSEIECGHYYARALASYGLLQALSGARYDAVDRKLYLNGAADGDFQVFLCTATGFGHVGLRGGQGFVDVKSGTIDVQEIVLAK